MEDNLTLRIPRGWSFEAEYLGNLQWADEKGEIPVQKNLTLYQRFWNVREWKPDEADIEDIYKTIDVQSGEVTWETKLLFHVDPENGRIIHHDNHPEARGLYYMFPQYVQKKDYEFFNYDLYPYTMKYQRTEKREGLDLYVFSFQGKLDYTTLYNLAYVPPAASAIGDYKIIVDDFYRELWVEPETGEIVHIIEDDPGDYLVDAATGEKKTLLGVWAGETTGNTVKYLLKNAQKRRWQMQLYRRWIPLTLLAAAVFLLAMSLFFHFRLKRGSL